MRSNELAETDAFAKAMTRKEIPFEFIRTLYNYLKDLNTKECVSNEFC